MSDDEREGVPSGCFEVDLVVCQLTYFYWHDIIKFKTTS